MATLTIWTVSNETSPSCSSLFGQADLDLDLADSEVAGVRVNLTLQWLKHKTFLAIGIRKLSESREWMAIIKGILEQTFRGSNLIET